MRLSRRRINPQLAQSDCGSVQVCLTMSVPPLGGQQHLEEIWDEEDSEPVFYSLGVAAI